MVDIATSYGLDGSRFESRQEQMIFFPKTVNEPPIQWIPRFFPLHKAAGNMKLTTCLHLGSILRIREGMPLPFSIWLHGGDGAIFIANLTSLVLSF